jgi:hypothetical protein
MSPVEIARKMAILAFFIFFGRNHSELVGITRKLVDRPDETKDKRQPGNFLFFLARITANWRELPRNAQEAAYGASERGARERLRSGIAVGMFRQGEASHVWFPLKAARLGWSLVSTIKGRTACGAARPSRLCFCFSISNFLSRHSFSDGESIFFQLWHEMRILYSGPAG